MCQSNYNNALEIPESCVQTCKKSVAPMRSATADPSERMEARKCMKGGVLGVAAGLVKSAKWPCCCECVSSLIDRRSTNHKNCCWQSTMRLTASFKHIKGRK